MPKRLLRYAMARFDIFEDDALDLENLDLGFGLRNTFEFKDVGLKVEVRLYATILALPSECPRGTCTDTYDSIENKRAAWPPARVPH